MKVRNISIKQKRVEAKMTQAELAKKIGIGQSAISQWEAGATAPRLEKLKLMSELFGCAIDDLVSEEGNAK